MAPPVALRAPGFAISKQDEATPAKEEYAKGHFERVNEKLSTLDCEFEKRG